MNKLKEIRESLKIKQEDMGKYLNKTRGAISHYETGRRTASLEMSLKIIDFFNANGGDVTINDVFPASKAK